jgi:hypothetical protein
MGQRPLPEDFKDFIRFLNVNNVEYLLVGGWAIGLYGNPRATKDIDFLIAVNEENLKKLEKALYEFGAPTIDMEHFKEPGNFFRMGRAPIQIDIITEASGIDIKDCYSRKNIITIDDIDVPIISKEDLIKNKKASGRLQDLADAESLENA